MKWGTVRSVSVPAGTNTLLAPESKSRVYIRFILGPNFAPNVRIFQDNGSSTENFIDVGSGGSVEFKGYDCPSVVQNRWRAEGVGGTFDVGVVEEFESPDSPHIQPTGPLSIPTEWINPNE